MRSETQHTIAVVNPLRPAAREKLFGFDVSLYDELILLIFSWLPARDLCSAQQVNKNWARLAQDQQLWKGLFMRTHGRERLRGSRGLASSAGISSDEAPLPTLERAGVPRPRLSRKDVKDWRWMFRVSSNWESGRCVVDSLPLDEHWSSQESSQDPVAERAHIILADGLTIIASSRPSVNPPILIYSGNDTSRVICRIRSSGTATETAPTRITALSVDQGRTRSGPPSDQRFLRLAAFYSNGTFSVFTIPTSDPTLHQELTSFSQRQPLSAGDTVSHAAYHHPLLISLSDSFTLSIYGVDGGSNPAQPIITRLHSLKSFTSFPPSSMVLSARPAAPEQPEHLVYKLVLSYAVAIFPAHWSVGVTDMTIHRRGTSCSIEHAQSSKASSSRAPSSPAIPSAHRSPPRSARRTSAPATSATEPDNRESPPASYAEADNAELQRARERMALEREQWARKVARVVATETDGRFVVLAGEQDGASLQVYRLSSKGARLVFVRNLFGHRSVVAALAVADGRCVSLGSGGEVWAWDLEAGIGVEVDGPPDQDTEPFASLAEATSHPSATVAFDERRILSRTGNDVQIRRFDL
ncbi:hypothetical protein AURDEDRAFT_114930 [Auricularia subglabra TFB-10046 SS5]|nr:hypothetical protein AURDEDRAFT_114930 [Auricularia subglabra TFB-10046 SS5]